jgi:pimeloyl-ACP methyl ester carboxylesterase
MFEGFESLSIDTGAAQIFARRAGSGAPILLLHGFPATHLMWRDIAPRLASTNTVVCADLRGYGQSSCPDSTADHAPYAKRALAADMVALMDRLGFERFSVVGHDRGGRVAQRMALDAPDRIAALAVLDIIPVSEAWDRADDRLALAFWPWSLLAQPAPLPETILTRCGDAIVADAATNWGGAGCDPRRGAEGICFRAAGRRPCPCHLRRVPGRRLDRPQTRPRGSRRRTKDRLPDAGTLEQHRRAVALVRRRRRAARDLAPLVR